jgi:hypothetical protein
MHVNGKMRTVETIPGMKEERIKENSNMIYYKNICKCHNITPAQQ